MFPYVIPLVAAQLMLASVTLTSGSKVNRICAITEGLITQIEDDGLNLENNGTVIQTRKCETDHCYAVWEEYPNGTIQIMGQGCWKSSDKAKDCERSECISTKKPRNNTKYCCCSEDLCNRNFTDGYVPEDDPTPIPAISAEMLPKQPHSPIIWIVAAVSILFMFIICSGAFTCFWRKMKLKKNDLENGQANLPPPEEFSLEKLKLYEIIGQGRYGSVWRGLVEEQEVAVKVFPPHHRNYFLNEHEIYKVAGENPALLKCFGGGDRCQTPGGPIEYVLIFNLEQESLQSYLRNNTIDMATLCKMSLGVAKGLAHLHSDLGKPCVAHRDINTRNVLVRSDLSCCICDLGLAVVPRRSENHSLSEAGTLRYMAPEVLEGAVNLRDRESALKQIDVYALGLVLWELGTRCVDMQMAEPQAYAPPYYKEAGENPSLEQMQALVSRRKARPLWPPTWKDTAAARLLCETAEDCWDPDAEARLTSLCVEERLLELPTLRGRVLHPMHPPASPTPLINNNHLHDHIIESSVGTIETLLSPTEEHCKNSNQLAACVTPLQPYQGRNPCLERNLLSGSSDCLLVDKSSKHCTSSESQNLIANDFLNFQLNPRAMPIPYVQNAVKGSPKRYNSNVAIAPKSKFKWPGFRKLFNTKKECNSELGSSCKETKVQIIPGKLINSFGQNGVTTTLLDERDVKEARRPSTLPLSVVKRDENKSNTSGVTQLLKNKDSLSRQRSLEQFNEVFSSATDLSKLKEASAHIKTPGDVPPSVRRTRGKAANESARFSLYDDRMMGRGQWGSAPDLDPPTVPLKAPQANEDRESISSF